MLVDFSFHPVPSGLWNFSEGDTDIGSSSWVFTSDAMHNDDLGVFLDIVASIPVSVSPAYNCWTEVVSNCILNDYNGFNFVTYALSQDYLKEKYKGTRTSATTMIEKLNSRLQSGVLPRASDFSLPYASGAYFPDHSRVQAKEHRNVMQILPHILNDIDDGLTTLSAQ